MKKKIGNAVKRNKIKRKLKAIVQNLLKKRGAINKRLYLYSFRKIKCLHRKTKCFNACNDKMFKRIK